MKSMKIVIRTSGKVEAIYSDALRPVLEGMGAQYSVRRASHVEPLGTKWTADLAPVGGPVLGPFDLHAEAIAAEIAWIDRHHLGAAAAVAA